MLYAHKYGAYPVGIFLGPGIQWINNAIAALGQYVTGSPRALARFLRSALLPTAIVSGKKAEKVTEAIEKFIEPGAEKFEDIFKN